MAEKKLKSGQFAVEVEEDPAVWHDRKRYLGLPLSFTQYTLTRTKLLLNTGLLNLHEEEVLLYRVRDVSLSRSLGERLFGVGTICIDSSDLSVPHLKLQHVKDPAKVKAVLAKCVEDARTKNQIRSTELMGAPGGAGGPEPCEDELLPGDEVITGGDDLDSPLG